jgi:hypothetical protein
MCPSFCVTLKLEFVVYIVFCGDSEPNDNYLFKDGFCEMALVQLCMNTWTHSVYSVYTKSPRHEWHWNILIFSSKRKTAKFSLPLGWFSTHYAKIVLIVLLAWIPDMYESGMCMYSPVFRFAAQCAARSSKLHKTITFGVYITGQYYFLNFLLKFTSFRAWRYKLDWYPFNHVLIAYLTSGAYL